MCPFGMKLKVTKTMIISRSRTMSILDGTVLKESDDLDTLESDI